MPSTSKTVLICDEDAAMRDRIAALLRPDYNLLTARSGESALTLLRQKNVDVLLLDARLPGINGFDLLRIVKENYPSVECLMIAAIDDARTAVQAIKDGAFSYLTKSAVANDLRTTVQQACAHQDVSQHLVVLTPQVGEHGSHEFLIGPSPAVREIVDVVQKVAKLSATVLILGESGTGKELLARLLHRESGREGAPFIAVNLSAIPHELVESTLFGHERGAFTGAHKQQLGKFEIASGGTLFLDEIGDLRFDLQAKLLRAIQEGEIERVGGTKPIRTNFRLVVATNVDLEKAVKQGRFREDLYYRINVIPIRMPPLRERMEDLPELTRLFLERYRVKFHKPVEGIADSALELLASYWWPGNIRELQNLIERLVAVSDREWITDEDLPLEYHFATLASGPSGRGSLFKQACDAFERNLILRALEKCEWNVTATARYLGLPLSTLKHKMARFDLRDLARKLRGA